MSDEMFSEAVAALKAGQRLRAKDLLTRLIKADAQNPNYWLWMSASVESEKEQIYCLQNVLRLDPNSIPARRGLVVLGALRPEESGLPPASLLQDMPIVLPEVSASGRLAGVLARRRSLERMALLGASALAVVVLTTACLAIFKLGPFAVRPNTVVVTSTVPPSSTPPPTATPVPVVEGACEIPANPNPATPLAVYLCLNQTATPNPVATDAVSPSEDYRNMRRAYDEQDWGAILQLANVVVNDQVLSGSQRVFFYLGEAYRHTGNQAEAVRQYGAALGLDGGFAPAYWGRALAQAAQNRRNDAVSDFGRAINADPNFIPAYLDRAAYLAAAGDPSAGSGQALDSAIADLEAARRTAPGNALAAAYLALAYLDAGEVSDAEEAAEAALEIDPGLALGYFARGRVAYANGDYDEAEADLSRAYRYVLDLEHPLAGRWQASVLHATALAEIATDNAAAALPLLNQAAEADPGNADVFLTRAGLHLSGEAFEEARADYSTAIDLLEGIAARSGELPDAYVGLGQALLGLERPDTAITAFQAALRRAPEDFAAQLGLGQALLGNERPADAAAALTTALDLASTNAQRTQAYFWRAQAYAALGEAAGEAADLEALASLASSSDPLAATAEARLTEIGPLPTATQDATLAAAATRTAIQAATGTAAAQPTATRTATSTPSSTPTPTPTRTPTRTATRTATP